MFNHTKIVVILFACFFLAGCSQKYNDVNATLLEALFSRDDIVITKAQIEQLPYASMRVKINDGPNILMVLAFADGTPDTKTVALKWVSSDGAMIVTEHGRITKTLNLYDANLVNVSTTPLNKKQNLKPTKFSAVYDWQPEYYFNENVHIVSEPINTSVMKSLVWKKKVTVTRESLTFRNNGITVDNYYWIDTDRTVLKSSQWLIPNQLHIEYEILKPYNE